MQRYDAWNRLVKVTKAYKPTPASELQTGSVVQLCEYDGLNRRIVKQVQNSADWDCTYHYYYNPGGWSILETRNGSGGMMKQQVFGTTYIDELVQIAVNRDPENAYSGTVMENDPEYYFHVAQDANYNVLGVVDQNGVLLERYEYTPYGRRTVYTHGYPLADLNGDGVMDNADYTILTNILTGQAPATQMADLNGDGVVNNQDIAPFALAYDQSIPQAADPWVSYPAFASFRPRYAVTAIAPVPLCEFGHQGLPHDEELANGQIVQNRNRFLHARFGRFGQQDPGPDIDISPIRTNQYQNGMSLYQYIDSNPLRNTDTHGLSPTGSPGLPGRVMKEVIMQLVGLHAGCILCQATDPNKKGDYQWSSGYTFDWQATKIHRIGISFFPWVHKGSYVVQCRKLNCKIQTLVLGISTDIFIGPDEFVTQEFTWAACERF